ncbi:spore coat protein CotH [Seminavis robusta]|uniref:Spore coat protein CotH n=1 Tax=Seminavis robusta TaxID=568900 RepID=A0A9N8HLF6_9STRA|nr:spore coat protein CotH [Seminavis robusta]|eukprot:Sro806_g205140.1 spore coat protein CotH (861) ;mRNA; f:27350-30082
MTLLVQKLSIFFALASLVQGNVVITEIADKGTSRDVCNGKDWIELYNSGDAAVSLDGYVLHDDKGVVHEEAFSFPLDAMIESQEYLLLCVEMMLDEDNSLVDPMSPQFGIGGDDTITLLRAVTETTEAANDTEAVVEKASATTLVVVSTVGPLPNTNSRFGVSYALDPDTNQFTYTQTPTPGAPNVISELLTEAELLANIRSALKAQNDLGTKFFGMDDRGYPVLDDEFPAVLDLQVSMAEEDFSAMMANASWELYKPFSNATLVNPETGVEVWSRTTAGQIRSKGQSSLWMPLCLDSTAIPFQLDFSSRDLNQTLFGAEKIYLRNHMSDYSYMRDQYYYRMLARFGLPHLRGRKTRLYINGQYKGLYTLLEAPDQDYVFARNFPTFDPDKYALFKVKSYALDCGSFTEEEYRNATIRLEELQAQATEDGKLPPYLFERGEHNPPVEVLGLYEQDQCLDNFLNDLWRTWVDVVVAYEQNDRDCGETLVNEGLIDLDLGTNNYKNDMKDFVNRFYRGDEPCTEDCANQANIDEEMDVQHALRAIAFYAALVVSDSPLISGNNFLLAATGDDLGWKFFPYDFNVARVYFCHDDLCNTRAVHWSIARPTCESLESAPLVGPLLSNPTYHKQYLEYVREFLDTVLTNSSLIEEIQDHAAAIRSFVREDPWALLGTYFSDELSPDAADWREEDRRFPLLPTMKARAEDLREQFASIDAGTFPRGPHVGVYGDNEPWEPCPDWRSAEANRTSCEQGCMYDGCHIPGLAVESFCDEETGLCFHGDYDERCRGIYDEEKYPGMENTEDGRETFCRFAAGVPVKAAQCPAPGAVTLSSSNTGESSASASFRVSLLVVVSGLAAVTASLW